VRSDLIDPTIAVHKWRVVKRTGDGLLAEFRSVVEAKLTKALSSVPDHAEAWRVAGVPES
jgi:class 3 adenylate cyclase